MDDDQNVLVCMPLTLMPVPAVHNAGKGKCSKCNAEVWVTPASRDVMEKHNAVILCVRCLVPGEDEEVHPMSPAQVQEFLDGIAPERN